MDDAPEKGRAIDLWRAVAQTNELVGFFSGIFDVIGITVEETGEELTVRVAEGKIHIDPGLPDRCDFLVPLKMENVTNMVSHAADGSLNAFETWRIASVLFTPLTRETLKNPVMCRGMLRRLARVEDLIHVRLLGPEAEQVASHTLMFASGQWLVIEGLHGRAKRTFNMTGDQCVTYQKQIFGAMKAGSILGWMRFARWYVKWRPSVSE